MTKTLATLTVGSLLITGCASPRVADNPNLVPLRIDADENGAAVMVDVAGGGNPFKRAGSWIANNPGTSVLLLGGAAGLDHIGDHIDWFKGGSKGDRKATYYHIENHGDNNRYIFVSDQGTASASGDSNTGSGGQTK